MCFSVMCTRCQALSRMFVLATLIGLFLIVLVRWFARYSVGDRGSGIGQLVPGYKIRLFKKYLVSDCVLPPVSFPLN